MSGWDKLRKEAKSLETFIDSQLSSYASSYQNTKGALNHIIEDESLKFEQEIEASLSKLSKVIQGMDEYINDSLSTPNSSAIHMRQRHRDIYFEYTKEFKRIKSSVQSSREHSQLMANVNQDIKYE